MLIDKKRVKGGRESKRGREGDGEIEGAVAGRGIMLIERKKMVRIIKEKLRMRKKREDEKEVGERMSEGERERERERERESS
jgi:hypothetical protein